MAAALLLGLGPSACATRSPLRIRPGPVVKQQVLASPRPFLRKLAVIPFQPIQPRSLPDPSAPKPEASDTDSAALIASFVGEALEERGVDSVPASDVALACAGAGVPVPSTDPAAAAARVFEDFAASAVLLGRVTRYREREGSSAGATRPASVAFEVSVHATPSGRRLWTGRFDETQQTLSGGVFRAREYPGGGMRWLTAGEFARWGARRMVEALLAVPAPAPAVGAE